MLDIRLQIEKLNEENIDIFVDILTKRIESEKHCYPDTAILNRLKEDAISVNFKYEAYLGKIGVDWVAYIIFTMSYSTLVALPSLLIDDIFVLNNFRNMGIGRAMFEFCIRKAKKRGCAKIEVIISNRNRKAKKFFEFNRAVPTDTTRYEMDPYIQIRKQEGKMTYSEFIRKKSKNKHPRLNSQGTDHMNLG